MASYSTGEAMRDAVGEGGGQRRRGLLRLRCGRRLGEAIAVGGGRTITPVTRSLSVLALGGRLGLSWSRPVEVRVTSPQGRGGWRLSIPDPTARLAATCLVSGLLVGLWLIGPRRWAVGRRRNHDAR